MVRKLTNEETYEFTSMLKLRTLLWDTTNPFYNSRTHRDAAIGEIGIKMNMHSEDVKKKIRGLQTQFGSHKKRILDGRKSGQLHTVMWEFFDALTFLTAKKTNKEDPYFLFQAQNSIEKQLMKWEEVFWSKKIIETEAIETETIETETELEAETIETELEATEDMENVQICKTITLPDGITYNLISESEPFSITDEHAKKITCSDIQQLISVCPNNEFSNLFDVCNDNFAPKENVDELDRLD